MLPLRCIIICVNYSDYLKYTLPYNRHHYHEVVIVTAERDPPTIEVARQCDAQVFLTDAFWEDGAVFNKFKALEQGLDHFGRHGLLAIKDADVLWPKEIVPQWVVQRGEIHTPFRRMLVDFCGIIPREEDWTTTLRRHHFQLQWTGYTQVFHADDPHLGSPPWHLTNWRYAGGGDTVFQYKWPANKKVRPPFEVLHLGPAETNWSGRASPYLDGRPREVEADQRIRHTRQMLQERHQRRRRGDSDCYVHERLNPPSTE